ncbi:MAG: hypothetical protein Q7J10_08935 [Methanosarcinaceae archaeon]|nr:hypothetical protein [Methanosarcinaceae archaeon]
MSRIIDYLSGKTDTYLIKIGTFEKRIRVIHRTGAVFVLGMIYLIITHFETMDTSDLFIANMVAFVLTTNIMKYTIDSTRDVTVGRLAVEHVVLLTVMVILIPKVLSGFILALLLNILVMAELQKPASS